MPPVPRPILHSEMAFIDLSTGVVLLRGSKSIFQRVLSGDDINDPQLARQIEVAYRHEHIHFIQTFTANYIFQYCERVRHLCARFAKWLNDPGRDTDAIASLRASLRDIENDFDRETGADPIDGLGISPRQLMEAAAIVESLRSINPVMDLKELMENIPEGSNASVAYGRVIGIMIRALGPAAPIKLLPALAFIALNHEEPGSAFARIVGALHDLPYSSVSALGSRDLFNAFWKDRTESLISQFARGKRLSASPFFNDVGAAFAKSGPVELMHLIAAQPSSAFALTNWSKDLSSDITQCVPPLVLFEDGLGIFLGAPKSWPQDKQVALLQSTELMGAMYRVGLQRNYTPVCMQDDCPAKSLGLCNMAYPPAPPKYGSWKDCAFRDRFRQLSGMTPEEFGARYPSLFDPPLEGA